MVPEGLNVVSKRVLVTRWSQPKFSPYGAGKSFWGPAVANDIVPLRGQWPRCILAGGALTKLMPVCHYSA
jgi:hypothetical protein